MKSVTQVNAQTEREPKLVSKLLSEITKWGGLTIVDLPLEEELMASEMADRMGLDFDDGLQYYYAKKAGLQIVSFDEDFDKTDAKRVEPKDIESSASPKD